MLLTSKGHVCPPRTSPHCHKATRWLVWVPKMSDKVIHSAFRARPGPRKDSSDSETKTAKISRAAQKACDVNTAARDDRPTKGEMG